MNFSFQYIAMDRRNGFIPDNDKSDRERDRELCKQSTVKITKLMVFC